MLLLEWIRAYLCRGDSNAPLMGLASLKLHGYPLTYRHFRLTIEELAKKACRKKGIWPYLFRHITLSKMVKVLTEAHLEGFAGWVHGSKMAARYVHFSTRDIKEAILALYGIEKIEGSMTVKVVRCPRRGGYNPEVHRFCSQCGLPMSMAIAYKAELSAREVVEAAESMEDMEKETAELKVQLLEIL